MYATKLFSWKRKGDLTINFIVDDGQNKIEVEYIGILPDLFREGQGVICEGKILGDNVGIFEVNDPYSSLELRDNETITYANQLVLSREIHEPN